MARQQDFQESGVANGLDRAESNSMLAGVLHDLEKTLQQALGWVAEYAGVQHCTVVIDDDFDHQKLEPPEVAAYLAAATSGVIDKATVLDALIRGDWLPESLTVEDVMDAAEEEQAIEQERQMETMAATAELEIQKAKAMPPKATAAGAGKVPAAKRKP